jgi:hypothetical protein
MHTGAVLELRTHFHEHFSYTSLAWPAHDMSEYGRDLLVAGDLMAFEAFPEYVVDAFFIFEDIGVHEF